MLDDVYNEMWQRFEGACRENALEIDTHLCAPEQDTRRGITALSYLKGGGTELLNRIQVFQERVNNAEPGQYVHPHAELHLTILSIISCIPEFELKHIDPTEYARIFNAVVKQSEPIEIEFRGVTATPACILLQGFPETQALEDIRHRLRQQLREAGLRVSFDSRYKLVTAHCSLIRFCHSLQNPERLLQVCNEFRHREFGRLILTDVELVFNNWYLNDAATNVLAKGTLSYDG